MDVERLLEAFGSSFSLETITSAYAQASQDVDLAGVILYELQNESKCGMDATFSSSEISSKDTLKHPYIGGGDNLKLKNGSSIIQSLEVHSNDSSTASCSITEKDDSRHEDVEDFLFKMLGDGFQLPTKTIHEVLGLCGYDLEKSIETLVDISASTLKKCDDVSRSTEGEIYLKMDSISKKQQSDSSLSFEIMEKQKAKKSHKKTNGKHDLQKEILGALFTVPGRVEEQPPKRTNNRSMRPRLHGRIAAEPMKELPLEETFVAVKPSAGHTEAEEREEENSFPVLRRALKENWDTMKEYYKSATDAFIKGDKVRAYKLLKEGQFYYTKAREADEKSSQALLESREEEELLLDLRGFDLKEAIKILKLQLSNFAGVHAIRYLKVNVAESVEENKNGRLRRLVLKLLERASIEWTEVDDGKTIVIKLDEIDPNALNFSK